MIQQRPFDHTFISLDADITHLDPETLSALEKQQDVMFAYSNVDFSFEEADMAQQAVRMAIIGELMRKSEIPLLHINNSFPYAEEAGASTKLGWYALSNGHSIIDPALNSENMKFVRNLERCFKNPQFQDVSAKLGLSPKTVRSYRPTPEAHLSISGRRNIDMWRDLLTKIAANPDFFEEKIAARSQKEVSDAFKKLRGVETPFSKDARSGGYYPTEISALDHAKNLEHQDNFLPSGLGHLALKFYYGEELVSGDPKLAYHALQRVSITRRRAGKQQAMDIGQIQMAIIDSARRKLIEP